MRLARRWKFGAGVALAVVRPARLPGRRIHLRNLRARLPRHGPAPAGHRQPARPGRLGRGAGARPGRAVRGPATPGHRRDPGGRPLRRGGRPAAGPHRTAADAGRAQRAARSRPDRRPRRRDPSSANAAIAAGVDPNQLVVHQSDLQAVVNALWAGGAEAMSIAGQRVVATSAVRCVGNTLLLNGEVFSPPFRVEAIGPAKAMTAALGQSKGVQAGSSRRPSTTAWAGRSRPRRSRCRPTPDRSGCATPTSHADPVRAGAQ